MNKPQFKRFDGSEWQLRLGNYPDGRWLQVNYYQAIVGVKAHLHIHRSWKSKARRIGLWRKR